MRCFVAFELSVEVRSGLVAIAQELRGLEPAWAGEKWVEPELMHVTSRFLGEVDDQLVPGLAHAIGEAAALACSFALEFDSLRAIPRIGAASLLWAEARDITGACRELADSVAGVAAGFGVIPEARPYVPHVTLVRARRKRPVDSGRLQTAWSSATGATPLVMSVPSVTFFRSSLSPIGPVHERIAQFALGHPYGPS